MKFPPFIHSQCMTPGGGILREDQTAPMVSHNDIHRCWTSPFWYYSKMKIQFAFIMIAFMLILPGNFIMKLYNSDVERRYVGQYHFNCIKTFQCFGNFFEETQLYPSSYDYNSWSPLHIYWVIHSWIHIASSQ